MTNLREEEKDEDDYIEGFENSGKICKPGRAYRFRPGTARISTGVASFKVNLLIGIFWTGFTLSGQLYIHVGLVWESIRFQPATIGHACRVTNLEEETKDVLGE